VLAAFWVGQAGPGLPPSDIQTMSREACGVAGEERVKMSSRSEGGVAEESGNGIRGGIDVRGVDMVVRGRSESCTGSKGDFADRTVGGERVTKVCVLCSGRTVASNADYAGRRYSP